MEFFSCPVCGEALENNDKYYRCSNRHTFDKSKSGYVNLLLSKHAGKSIHGDNKLMVQARRNFLDKGYYAPLKDAICNSACRFFNSGNILDAGCGEGYYTGAVAEAVDGRIYGVDISKTAVDFAAKRYKNISFAAASIFHLPVYDSSCNMLITAFSPYCGDEFRRVLKADGIMIMAIPSEMHLWEIKQAVYDTPYKNEVKPYELEGFELVENQRISYRIFLPSQEDIKSLFSMTPYYYRTGKTQRDRLAFLEQLETQADFELLVYRKL